MGLLDQVIGAVLGSRMGGAQRGGSGMNPLVMALVSLLASRAMGNRGGGMGGMLGGMLGGGTGGMLGGGTGSLGSGMGGGLGGLGGLLGGAAGAGGLGALIERFTQNGHADTIHSWVGHGENRSIAPNQLEEALGPDTVEDLSRQTGMPRQDLLSELSHVLPGVVDKLTPHGRPPNDDDMQHW